MGAFKYQTRYRNMHPIWPETVERGNRHSSSGNYTIINLSCKMVIIIYGHGLQFGSTLNSVWDNQAKISIKLVVLFSGRKQLHGPHCSSHCTVPVEILSEITKQKVD